MLCYERMSLLIGFCIALFSVQGRYTNGIKQGKETWGYVSVREGAHMFFWLYYTTADVDYKTRPLVIWLQGGPGASSTGIGNFLEIGPQDTLFNNRTNAWNEHVNVLFIDNPVGTGFSYVDDPKQLANNNTVIGNDLVEFMKGFLLKVPEFENVPMYIFAESYGGKMAVRFAQTLNKAVISKKIKCQVAGVAMGDSWISPVEAVSSWGPYLYHTSLVDSIGLSQINAKASEVEAAVKSGAMKNATQLWSETETVVEKVTNGVNFYNILTQDGISAVASNKINNQIKRFSKQYLGSLYHRHIGALQADLDKIMNGPVRDKLKVIPKNITWGGQSALVFEALSEDFMNSAVQNVEVLLNTTSMKVVVYNGQLDLIVDTPGVEKWVENLHWAGTKGWLQANRKPILSSQNVTDAFSKSYKNFHFYWILKAGHMVPMDASEMAVRIMKEIVGVKE